MSTLLKWIIQISAMLGDLLLLAAAAIVMIYSVYTSSLGLIIVSIALVCIAYKAWRDQGGLIAWRERKVFMKNWDKLAGK